jgi:hypothetical protein
MVPDLVGHWKSHQSWLMPKINEEDIICTINFTTATGLLIQVFCPNIDEAKMILNKQVTI